MQLTQKEKMLLQEEISQEQLCIDKYEHSAQQVQCPELKQLFTTIGAHEQQHLNTLNTILSGQVPSMGQGGGQGGSSQGQMPNVGGQGQGMASNTTGGSSGGMKGQGNKKDAMLCQDALATEKYVSGLYNMGIFEFRDTNIRQALNHIQKEEQQHGEQIYNYMASHGYYPTMS